MAGMGVREDCRHYVHRSTSAGDVLQRCRLGVNQEHPFACLDDCLFFEDRRVTAAGWTNAPTERMSNTADGLENLPPPKRRRRKR
jgi:hypothetical protein